MEKYLLCLISGLSIYANTSFAQSKPNFLIFVTDDQTYNAIGTLGNSDVVTPNLDRLVHNGTTFTHAFNQGSWSSSVSVASRLMLITGQYMKNAICNDIYIDDWARVKHEEPSTQVPLIGETFRNNGYKTFVTGKWDSNEALLRNFDEGQTLKKGVALDEKGNRIKIKYKYVSEDYNWDPSNPKLAGHWRPKVRRIVQQEGVRSISEPFSVNKHSTEVNGEAAINFIHKQKANQPFLMYVAFYTPHDPRQAPRRFVEMYSKKDIKLPHSYLPQHPFDQGDSKVRDEMLAPFPRSKESIYYHRRDYYATISHTDEVIGRIIDELERSGLDDNTYIIFTSDHGLAVGNHGLMGKQNLYDHSIRVPFIIKGPNIKPDIKIHNMIYMQSIYATVCDLAQINIPATIDYKSIVPMLKDSNKKGEEYIWARFKDFQRTIRSEQYKLIIYLKARRIQLFDMQKDPYEKVNLASDKAYASLLKKMFKLLQEKEKTLGNNTNLGQLSDYN